MVGKRKASGGADGDDGRASKRASGGANGEAGANGGKGASEEASEMIAEGDNESGKGKIGLMV